MFGAVDGAADVFLTCWYVVAYKSKEPTKNLHKKKKKNAFL